VANLVRKRTLQLLSAHDQQHPAKLCDNVHQSEKAGDDV
jgi:hypothetical protein